MKCVMGDEWCSGNCAACRYDRRQGRAIAIRQLLVVATIVACVVAWLVLR